MKRFRSRPDECRAYQFNAGSARALLAGLDPSALERFYPGVRAFDPTDNDTPFAVKTTSGQYAVVEDGDWVVAEPDGNGHYPCKDHVFRRRWEPID